MNLKLTTCKKCGTTIAKIAKACPHCGTENKQPIFMKWWFWTIIVTAIIGAIFAGCYFIGFEGGNDTPGTEATTGTTTPAVDLSSVKVGNEVTIGNKKIIYVASGEYKEDSNFMRPKEGYKHVFLEFVVENIGKEEESISCYDFDAEVDGSAFKMYFGSKNKLSAKLSPGRSVTGMVYFTVPKDTTAFDVEYVDEKQEHEKVIFKYEGEKDCEYVHKSSADGTEGALAVGDSTEYSDLKISYVSCEEYVSDASYAQPKEGYRYVTCEFEFENTGKSNRVVTAFGFSCFADGMSCEATYARDDDLNATIEPGQKTKGTVTFEVPVDASVIEVEYVTNMWTKDRVVFTVETD